jgi:uncharacterized damage-inducible protein DinB
MARLLDYDGPMNDQRFLDLSAGYLDEYARKIRKSAEGLSEDQLWWRPNPASNSIGNLVLHLCGNLSQWVLASLGGVPYERQRDAEFSARGGKSKATLLDRLDHVVASCRTVIRSLPAAELLALRTIRGDEVDGVEAVYHAVEHMSYHTGQIASFAKELAGRDLDLD